MPKVVSRLEVTPVPSIVFSTIPKVDKTNKDIVHVKTEKPYKKQFGTKADDEDNVPINRFSEEFDTLDVTINEVQAETVQTLDDAVVAEFQEKNRFWFGGKAKNLEYKPLLREWNEEKRLRIKIQKSTGIYIMEDGAPRQATPEEALKWGSKAVIKAEIRSLWASDTHFGTTFVARVILVKPGPTCYGMEELE